MNDDKRRKGRSVIYSLAGIYLLYLAYGIFGGLSDLSGGEKTLLTVIMVLFAVLGVGMIAYSLRAVKRDRDRNRDQDQENGDSSGEQ